MYVQYCNLIFFAQQIVHTIALNVKMHLLRLSIIFCTFKVILSNLGQILPRNDILPLLFSCCRTSICPKLYSALQCTSIFLQSIGNFILNLIQLSFQNSSVFYTNYELFISNNWRSVSKIWAILQLSVFDCF